MLASYVRDTIEKLGFEVRRKPAPSRSSWRDTPADAIPEKGIEPHDRFREILADPLNILIERVPMAGVVKDDLVMLHTGVKVPISGAGSYYRRFSDILAFNRGVHEPLEEFVFQEVVKAVGPSPVMLELGAYWGHYSMWLKTFRPAATVYLVEPDPGNLAVGTENFKRNGLEGTFINAMVGNGHFEVDRFLADNHITHLDILHADIQGAEMEMLAGCERALREARVSYCFVSTHSQELHAQVAERLRAAGFRIEASADFEHDTTSYDGLVFAVHESIAPVLTDFRHLGREQLATATPGMLLDALAAYAGARRRPAP